MVAIQHGGAAVARNTKTEANVGQAERIASVAVGGTAALAALRMLVGRHLLLGVSLAAGGAYLLRRGLTGHCALYETFGVRAEDADKLSNPFTRELRTENSMTVMRSPQELYRLWCDPEAIVQFLPLMERVDQHDDRHLHFVSRDPDSGQPIEWDAEITEDRPGQFIAWRHNKPTPFTAGQITFSPAAGERGTVVRLEFRYRVPGGVFGAAFNKLRGRSVDERAREILRRFKQFAETGEVATNEGPFGARDKRAGVSLPPKAAAISAAPCPEPAARAADVVQEASEESFPASDAPAWS